MKHTLGVLCGLFLALGTVLCAAELDSSLQTKLDDQVKQLQTLAALPEVVAAVKAQNAQLPPELAAMTQDKWKTTNLLDPVMKSLSKNAAAEALRTHKSPVVSEAFVSDAQGRKVAFLSKPTNWSHLGKPKHDLPMQGKSWQGDVEVDASTGLQQVQVALPILDGQKPIGSLVVGLALSKLK